MGDRCNMELYIWNWDDLSEDIRSRIECDLAEPEECEYNGFLCHCLDVEEINYAGYEELQWCAENGVLFDGTHGAGGDYDAQQFCVDEKGQVLYVHPDGPCGVISEAGNTDPQALIYAKLWYAAKAWLNTQKKAIQ